MRQTIITNRMQTSEELKKCLGVNDRKQAAGRLLTRFTAWVDRSPYHTKEMYTKNRNAYEHFKAMCAPIRAGLQLAYDVADQYNQALFDQTMLMYFMGVRIAFESAHCALGCRLCDRVFEVFDIEPCFNAVFPVPPYGCAREYVKSEKP